MVTKKRGTTRDEFGNVRKAVMDLPDLAGIQLESYENFLQLTRLRSGDPLLMQGLEEVFQSVFPIRGGDMVLEYVKYELNEDGKPDEFECRSKGHTYSALLKARINLLFLESKEIRQKDIYFGDIPLMTERGTFVYNGAERVVVSQIHRSPGVIFSFDKGVHAARIIPYRGSWLEFEVDSKNGLLYAKIDRKKRVLGTTFLRALGVKSSEEIAGLFYAKKKVRLSLNRKRINSLTGQLLACNVVGMVDGVEKLLLPMGHKLHPHDVDELIHTGINSVMIIDMEHEDSLHSPLILDSLERDRNRAEDRQGELSRVEALTAVYSALRPGEPITWESAEADITSLFFDPKRYNLGRVGRYKLNKKFNYAQPISDCVLTLDDIVNTMRHLAKVYIGDANVDDIDHLGNRRIRSVGELFANQMKVAFSRLERVAKERMAVKENDTIKPQDIISIKPIISAVKEFFGSSQLSQFMDQVNPLAALTHKRRLNALGPGGLSRERAGFEVRDVHYTHYGRMCPIETPEGPNIGLIVSLANYTRVNEYGFLETPYRKVSNGRATKSIEYLSAIDEEKYCIAQANAELDDKGFFKAQMVSVRKAGDYTSSPPKDIDYMDVSPRQIISVSASLIPFLEHDDANRALMGSNMQRQAVPLLFPHSPLIGTGMERKAATDSGVLVKAKRSGTIVYVSNSLIRIKPSKQKDKDDYDDYPLLKYMRTNQDTCSNQRPLVSKGQKVVEREVIADGAATSDGELALGRDVLVGFIPWNGYNFEDSILISERVVQNDMFTSVHIKEFQVEIRETKLGPEKLTRDIPNVSERATQNLDEHGIVLVGTRVQSGNILVGKVTPRTETETTPEFKLLNSIFGEKAKDVRDTSLKLPHGVEGTVLSIQRLNREQGDDLTPGVDEIVKVLVVTKRKLKEGDKIAGRHGNKGVVSRIMPVEDMPYMADGTPLDVCLNPLGVPSRMNIGQILETQLGLLAASLGKKFAVPVFESAPPERIAEELKKNNLPFNAKTELYDGLTGEKFVNPVLIGYMHILKLHHLVDDKMHARSTGPYSLVTQQPLGGKAQFGGQRLGEMEVWALEAYGAANTLQELLTIKSDDMLGRSKIYESIVKGEPSRDVGVPESFNVLVQEMRGLALDLSIYDDSRKLLALTERDEELLNRGDF